MGVIAFDFRRIAYGFHRFGPLSSFVPALRIDARAATIGATAIVEFLSDIYRLSMRDTASATCSHYFI